ncbi:MAG: sigma 54-interacting transcriptional regulator [Polyangiaceae bacterium]|nr:sigma 54-interacting transcriptional regulator [Polyangiaceae bacterium]
MSYRCPLSAAERPIVSRVDGTRLELQPASWGIAGVQEAVRRCEWNAEVQRVAQRGPREVLQAEGRDPAELLRAPRHVGDSVPPHVRELEAKAEEIVYAKTVFVLPERVGSGSRELGATTAFVSSVVEQLTHGASSRLVDGEFVCHIGVAFIPSKPAAAPQDAEADVNVRDNLFGQAIASISMSAEQRVRRWLRPGPILFQGPSGSGKSAAAARLGRERPGPFVHVNVSAIPETLVESRMRGHAKGSFTGANKAAKGWFENAHRGTLLLDEFQKAEEWVQTQLLDLLSATSDTVTVARMGEDEKRRVCDVKVVIALNEQLSDLIEQKRFRQDLANRVRHIESFPPLDDITSGREPVPRGMSVEAYLAALLVAFRWRFALLSVAAGDDTTADPTPHVRSLVPSFSNELIAVLRRRSWRGNYRELERLAADLFEDLDRSQRGRAEASLLPSDGVSFAPGDADAVEAEGRAVALRQRSKVVDALERALLLHDFVLSRVVEEVELRDYKISTRRTLVRRLIAHETEFSPEVREKSKFRRIVERSRSP